MSGAATGLLSGAAFDAVKNSPEETETHEVSEEFLTRRSYTRMMSNELEKGDPQASHDVEEEEALTHNSSIDNTKANPQIQPVQPVQPEAKAQTSTHYDKHK